MPRYLLDTNIISDAIKNPHGPTAKRIIATSSDSLCTSVIVAAELRFGTEKKGSPALTARVEQVLNSLPVIALDCDADRYYGQLRANLEQRGALIGANDMLIAAHALAIEAILVTDNTDEFARIIGLQLENWLIAKRI